MTKSKKQQSTENKIEWTAKKVSLGGSIIISAITLIVGIFLGTNWNNFSPYLGFNSTTPHSDSSTYSLDWSPLDEVYSKLAANYDGDIDTKQIIEGAKKGLVDSLGDIYTVYMDADESKEFEDSLHGEVGGGIGIEFGIRNGYPTVIRTLPDNPARKAGILAGDIIYKIDDEEVWNLSSDDVANKTRGEIGTKVKITVLRNNKEKSFTLTREEINNVSAYINYDGKTAILTITRFDVDTGSLVSKLANEAVNKNVNKIILDLRNNGGGYVSSAKEVLSLWLDGEKILIQKSKNNSDEVTYANHNKAILSGLKTIVLVNESTASASEIVAGALKDYEKATIVGEQTFGKGVVQNLYSLSNETLLKVTIASWYTPLGNSINQTGITPDIKVELTYDDANNLRDPQLDKAKSL